MRDENICSQLLMQVLLLSFYFLTFDVKCRELRGKIGAGNPMRYVKIRQNVAWKGQVTTCLIMYAQLGQITIFLYPKYYKNSDESCIFAVMGKCVKIANFGFKILGTKWIKHMKLISFARV